MNAHQTPNPPCAAYRSHRPRQPPNSMERAARLYADAVSHDNATWVWAFLSALRTNSQLVRAKPGCRNLVDSGIPSGALLRYERYARSARHLYAGTTHAGMNIVRVRRGEHDECIAIRTCAGVYAGVLLAPRIVLTTARIAARADDAEVLVAGRMEKGEWTIDVEKSMLHPGFDLVRRANDLGLLLLKFPVNGIRAPRIAESSQIEAADHVKVVGFGLRDRANIDKKCVKRAAHLAVAAACAGDLHGVRGWHAGYELVLGKPPLADDGCLNNGGEPMYVGDGSRWYLAGILSRPMRGAGLPCGSGDICVRVDRYVKWIREAMASWAG